MSRGASTSINSHFMQFKKAAVGFPWKKSRILSGSVSLTSSLPELLAQRRIITDFITALPEIPRLSKGAIRTISYQAPVLGSHPGTVRQAEACLEPSLRYTAPGLDCWVTSRDTLSSSLFLSKGFHISIMHVMHVLALHLI